MSEPEFDLVDGRLGVLLTDRGNESVLSEWLDELYASVIVISDINDFNDPPIDLLVLDVPAFEEHRSALIDRKRAAEPSLLPYLLVHPQRPVPADQQLREYVDELITVPTDKSELAWRIDTLLRMRDLSLQVTNRSEQIEELASAAAHDLRNPLQVAQLWVPELGDDETVSRIERALDRMESLIEKVLAVAHSGEQFDESAVTVLGFRTVVTECWDVVPNDGAVLCLEDPRNWCFRGEPSLTHQLIENLLRNAVTHGGERVRIRVGVLEDASGFYVEDDGPGIPQADRDRVFESGYSTASGSGLGLAVVARAARAHGWDVLLTESEWGGARYELSGMEPVA